MGAVGVALLAVGPQALRAWGAACARFAVSFWRHRAAVWRAGRALRVRWWRLALHDCARLHPRECLRYVGGMHLREGDGSGVPAARRRLWLAAALRHHYAACAHHHEHYVDDRGLAAPMPEQDVREMVADWCALGLESGGGPGVAGPGLDAGACVLGAAWCEAHVPGMVLHDVTTARIIAVLDDGGIRCDTRVRELFAAKLGRRREG